VQVQLGHRVPGPQQHEHRVVAITAGAGQPADAVEHRVGLLGDQLVPVLAVRRRRVRHAQPPARRAVGGQQVQPAVALDPRRAPHRVGLVENRAQSAVAGQVGDPDRVPRRGPRRGADQQPAPVARGGDAEVVGQVVVQAGALDQPVARLAGAHPAPPHPAVELLLAAGHLVRRQPAHVEQLLAAGQPRDRRVAAPVDRPVQPFPGGDVEHVQPRLLVAADRGLVRQPVTLDAGVPGVQRGLAGRVDRRRVDQRALAAVRLADQQHRVLLARRAPGEERPAGPPDRHRHRADRDQLAQPWGQRVAPRQ
jgi:hypothetical protein